MKERILDLMEATPGCMERIEAMGLDRTGLSQILGAAGRLADDLLVPLGASADAEGCGLVEGRVVTPKGYGAAYRRLGADGWIAPDLAPDVGGQGLPLAVQAAANLAFEGAATAFMMAAGASRAAAHLLSEAAPELAASWAPKLASGAWTATICISEPDAGSDVGRIRTRAVQDGERWRIDGTKCWISFGDHDFADRIGHLLLARTGTAEEGTRGLSLFLVPNLAEGGGPNGISVERIEDKLGLHGSPTCVLRFEAARGVMLGAPGRGLPTLFGMIELMRLQVAGQGAGIALRAAAVARAYAAERRQGGPADRPPVPIADHADVRRQLRGLDMRAAILVALVLEVACALDDARAGDEEAAARAAFLLPLAKTFGGEMAFETVSGALQVLGGAGYTREWPVERYLRDARILTIYEGTTGMQAQDFLFRRLIRDRGAGLQALVARLRAEREDAGPSEFHPVAEALEARFGQLSAHLSTLGPESLQDLADVYLRAGWSFVSSALCLRLAANSVSEEAVRDWLLRAEAQMHLAERQCGLK